MTDRAKRAAEVLRKLGWSLDAEANKFRTCPRCDHSVKSEDRYCAHCGQQLEFNPGADAIDDIEAAIAAAVDHD